jgi:hypothetical protein
MSQDTGHTDGTVQSEKLQAPMMRRVERRTWAALPGAEGSRDQPPDGPVIHTDHLYAACADSKAGTAARRRLN